MGDVFSVWGIMKLVIAIFLDIFGLLCLTLSLLGTVGAFIGESLSFIPDVLGLVIISGCSFKKIKNKRFLFALIGELLPFIGAFFFWTFYVLSESKE